MRTFIVALVLCALIAPTALKAEKPNIVVFYADDLGIGDLSVYGCQDIQTPTIDGLARRGVRFTNYYSAAPICSPSRAALTTGRYPQRAGVPTNVSSLMNQRGMPPEQITFAELAKSAGYVTGLVGKWHLGSDQATQANSQGFDYFYGYHACIDYWSHMFYYGGNVPHYHDLYRNRIEVFEDGTYFTDLQVREALGFIDDHRDEHFFLYVPFHEPHYPMQAPRRFVDQYKHLSYERREYAGLVSALDNAMGTIMQRLERYDLVDNTLVFFMSDNGPSAESRANGQGGSSGPHRGNKFSLYEGGIRMPAIVSWPARLPKNETRDQMTIACDVWPTIAEAIGASAPKDYVIDGKSWLPLFSDAKAKSHETLYWEWNNQHAVRQGKWKVVRNGIITHGMSKQSRAEGKDYVFLSDLEADPGEKRNLAAEHPDIAERLLKMHDSWRGQFELKQ